MYAPLLRLSAANAGNDHRLGANEAPPAIISMFLGDQLTEILDCIADERELKKRDGKLVEVGVTTIPRFPMDTTDRNRTSPFAFTGNKFEFRMVGSLQSLAGPNTMINTVVAEILSEVADRLERSENVMKETAAIIKEFYSRHRRIVFNGNGYAQEWVAEALSRGLPNLTSTVSALAKMTDPEYVKVFEKHGVFSKAEIESREEIYLETYSKQINIEAGIMAEMAKRMIVPASTRYLQEVLDSVKSQTALGLDPAAQKALAEKLSIHVNSTLTAADTLEDEMAAALAIEDDTLKQAKAYRNTVIPAMAALRTHGDMLEKMTDKAYWPFPSYEDMLFRL